MPVDVRGSVRIRALDGVQCLYPGAWTVACDRVDTGRAMSQENGELVRAICARWEHGPISATTAVLFQFRGGQVTRLVLYWDRARALADLGVVPETGSRE